MESVLNVLLWGTYLVSLYFVVFWLLVFVDGKPTIRKKKLQTFPLVSIIIPAFNEEDCVVRTLRSALKLAYPKQRLDIIVVNDGSTDGTRSLVEDFLQKHKGAPVRFLHQENKGKGAALNAGLRAAKGSYFICLDSDSFVGKDSLQEILPYFSDSNVASVLPVLKVRKPGNFLQRMQWFEYLINMFYKELMSRLNCIHVAPGPFSIYRTSILRKVGGFDEDHNLTEDLEMALRLQSKHYTIIQVLEGEVSTIAPKNLRELFQQRNRWYKGSIINAMKYRKMMFNSTYGDFGMMQMPLIVGSGIIAIVIIAALAYFGVWVQLMNLLKIQYIGFDFLTLMRSFTFDVNILDFNYTNIFVAVVMVLLTLFVFSRSHNATKERGAKYGYVSIVMFIFAYFILLGVIWIGIASELLLGKRQRW